MQQLWMEEPNSGSPTYLAHPLKPLLSQIYAGLDKVRDPFHGHSILSLAMVDDVQIDGHEVRIICQLPALGYSQAAAFALSAAIHAEIVQVPGAWTVDVVMLSDGNSTDSLLPLRPLPYVSREQVAA